jgi:hypothetical protein
MPKNSRTAANALDLINKHQALIKVIQSNLHDDTHWEFLLKQLADPEHVRPIKTIARTVNRQKIYNAQKRAWERRQITGQRGRNKKTVYTKKTATSLLPKNGRMNFFNLDGTTVGLLFDVNECRLDPKYIFNINAATSSAWWLSGSAFPQTTTLDEIRKFQDNHLQPYWNEILSRLSKESVMAIFTKQDFVTDRLNALHKKFLVKKHLGIDLPVLVITPETGHRIYNNAEQISDIATFLLCKTNTTAYQFATKVKAMLSPTELMDLVYHYINHNNFSEASDLMAVFPRSNVNFFTSNNSAIDVLLTKNNPHFNAFLLTHSFNILTPLQRQAVIAYAFENNQFAQIKINSLTSPELALLLKTVDAANEGIIHRVIKNNYQDQGFIDTLCAKGVNLEAKNIMGQSPLQLALSRPTSSLFKHLITTYQKNISLAHLIELFHEAIIQKNTEQAWSVAIFA